MPTQARKLLLQSFIRFYDLLCVLHFNTETQGQVLPSSKHWWNPSEDFKSRKHTVKGSQRKSRANILLNLIWATAFVSFKTICSALHKEKTPSRVNRWERKWMRVSSCLDVNSGGARMSWPCARLPGRGPYPRPRRRLRLAVCFDDKSSFSAALLLSFIQGGVGSLPFVDLFLRCCALWHLWEITNFLVFAVIRSIVRKSSHC